MSFRLRIAFAVLWLCCSGAVSAQIGFSIPFVNAAVPGTNKNMTIKVTNFDSIVSMQYVIRWNPLVLKYLTIDNFGALAGLDIQDFNTQHAVDSGFLKLQYEGPNVLTGVSVADGTTIYRIRFNVIGADTSSTPIKFTEITNTFPVLDFEVVKVIGPNGLSQSYDEHQCSLTNGFVAVGYTVAAEEPNMADAMALTISPNPFSDRTKAEFYLEQSADVQWLISDAAGRILFQKDMSQLPIGKHTIDIDKAIFQTKGAYFLTVRAGSETSVRPLICN